MQKIVITVFFCVVFVGAALAASPRGPQYEGIRSMGMGNTTVAVTTDRTAIFHNPAGLGLLKDQFQLSITPVMLSIDGKILTYLNILNKQKDALADIKNIDSSFFNAIGELDGYWAGLEYSPEITIAKKNLGFGFYTTLPLDVKIETGHFIPKLGIQGQRDMVFTWAFGVPLADTNNYMGVSMAYFQRMAVPEQITSYSETFVLFDKVSKNPLGAMDGYAPVERGMSINVGFMHNFSGLRLAYDVRDLFALIGGDFITPRVDVGVAYYFPQLEKLEFIRSIILSAEVSNLFGVEPKTGIYENFGKKIHAGAEIDIFMVSLRGGINQGYPTFGVGISLGVLNLDYVYFQEEAGYFPGQMVSEKHVLSINMGINVPEFKQSAEQQLGQ